MRISAIVTLTSPLRVPGAAHDAAPTIGATLRCAIFVVAIGCAAATDAQEIAEPPRSADGISPAAAPPETKREGRARFVDPKDGQFDLGYFLEDPRGFLPIPILVTEPAVGYGGGAAGMFLRPRKEAGEEGWARPDISAIAGLATQNGTWATFAGDASRWLDGRLRTLAGAGTGQVNLDFYGLGLDRPSFDQKVRYSLQFNGAVVQANWQLGPKSPWAIGLRYVFADVDPKLRDQPAFPGLTDGVRLDPSSRLIPGTLRRCTSRKYLIRLRTLSSAGL